MSLIFTSPFTTTFNPRASLSNPSNTLFLSKKVPSSPLQIFKSPLLYQSKTLSFTCHNNANLNSETKIAFNYDFDEELSNSPWEGAVVYKRDPTVAHLEYCTTLERLGFGKFSTEVSKSRASIMGLRVTKVVKDYPSGTPVMVSIDVCRKKRKLRLDGIIKTVLTLGCNRCGEPAAECVFSNFTLLLHAEAVEEEDVIDMGVMFGVGKHSSIGEDEDDDDASIDMDDRLYFPAEEREIDISKNIRDLIHVEITINAVCSSGCKGLCLLCGANLNTSRCRCKKQEEVRNNFGPLRNLKNEMQNK